MHICNLSIYGPHLVSNVSDRIMKSVNPVQISHVEEKKNASLSVANIKYLFYINASRQSKNDRYKFSFIIKQHRSLYAPKSLYYNEIE
jgi:hypothetical protein